MIMKRFYEKVHIKGLTDCWEWLASTRAGYGAFKFNGRVDGAHRVSWIINNGPIPDGLFVCHTCDNRKCVNPNHLFLGTQSDNMKDAMNKGRIVVPVGTPFQDGHLPVNRVLSDVVVRAIKLELTTKKLTQLKISEKFDTKHQTIKDISAGRSYTGVI